MRTALKKFLSAKNDFAPAILLFHGALGVRLLYFYFSGASGSFDTLDYLKLADNLYNFGAYSLHDYPNLIPSLRRAPGYPFFLTFFQALAGGQSGLQSTAALVQCALDAGTAVAVYFLCRKVAAKPFAVAAGLCYALHPGAIARTNLTLTETLFAFLLVASVLALVAAVEKEKISLLSLGAALLGLAVLTRPLAGILALLFVYAVRRKVASPRRNKFITIFGAAFLLTLAPWLVRCYLISGQFVFVQGVTAFQYYAPTRTDIEQWDEERLWREFFDPNTPDEYFKRLSTARTPAEFVEAEKIGRRQALENIRRHPREYLLSRIRAYPYFFLSSFDNFTGFNKSYRALFAERSVFAFAAKVLLLLVFSVLPLILSLIGLFRLSRNLTSVFCALIWLTVLFLHLPMWIEYRFWVPFVPFQIVSAIAGVGVLRDRLLPPEEAES